MSKYIKGQRAVDNFYARRPSKIKKKSALGNSIANLGITLI